MEGIHISIANAEAQLHIISPVEFFDITVLDSIVHCSLLHPGLDIIVRHIKGLSGTQTFFAFIRSYQRFYSFSMGNAYTHRVLGGIEASNCSVGGDHVGVCNLIYLFQSSCFHTIPENEGQAPVSSTDIFAHIKPQVR